MFVCLFVCLINRSLLAETSLGSAGTRLVTIDSKTQNADFSMKLQNFQLVFKKIFIVTMVIHRF